MVPIYEQGDGRGIGYGLQEFLARFDQICRDHVTQNRATAFALIFYDFHEHDIRAVLKDQGVFAQLDRLSGNRLSVFYLHTAGPDAVEAFNSGLLRQLELSDATPPCVVFFKFSNSSFSDIAVAQLNSANLIHAFHELYQVIESYLDNPAPVTARGLRYLRWMISALRFVSIEAVKDAIQAAMSHLPF